MKFDAFSNLNEEQAAEVKNTEGYYRVIAGAGSIEKTYTICNTRKSYSCSISSIDNPVSSAISAIVIVPAFLSLRAILKFASL